MSQVLEDIADKRQGFVKSWVIRFVSPHLGPSAEGWSPGLWFAALQRSAAGIPWYRKPWLLPAIGCALLGAGLGLLIASHFPFQRGPAFSLQLQSLVTLFVVSPAFAWQFRNSNWYFRRLLDQTTFEQLMVTPLGSLSVLKDTYLHLTFQGLPVYVAALLGYFVAHPGGMIVLIDSLFYLSLVYVVSGAALGIQFALRVPLTEDEKAQRRARWMAAFRQFAINLGRFSVRFSIFFMRVLIPLAAIAGLGWIAGVYVHPALGWMVAMFGGMAFIVTLLIVASAKQIGTPLPPLPPLQQPAFRDLWEDRLRRYFDRGVVA
jgi:hypothetical protein